MSQRYFPIKTNTACRLKWSWSTLYLNNGDTGSCHRASISRLDPENFKDFHNTPQKLQARETMLQGLWPGDGCEYCRDIENSGGQSDRQFQNLIPNIYPESLDTVQTARVDPVVLEIFFNNTCNLRCVYCKELYSSSIEQENRKFGYPVIAESRQRDNDQYHRFAPLFWNWLEQHGQGLRRVQVLGGETLLQDDLYQLIEFYDQNPAPELEFNIVTNLIVPARVLERVDSLFQNLLEQKKIGRVDIQASVDSWDPSQSYVRYGFDHAVFERNLETLMRHGKYRIGLLSTVCSLTIMGLPALFNKWTEWNQKQKLFWYPHLVLPNETSPFSPLYFDYDLWQEPLQTVINNISESNWDDKQTKLILQGIQQKLMINCQSDCENQINLVKYLEEFDRRRGLDWRDSFPWLEKVTQNVV